MRLILPQWLEGPAVAGLLCTALALGGCDSKSSESTATNKPERAIVTPAAHTHDAGDTCYEVTTSTTSGNFCSYECADASTCEANNGGAGGCFALAGDATSLCYQNCDTATITYMNRYAPVREKHGRTRSQKMQHTQNSDT